MPEALKGVRRHAGSCHCGTTRFEVDLDASSGGMCNCSICQKGGALASIVKPEAFRLLTPESHLSFYEWGPKVSKRYFCKSCGVMCFARGHLEQLGGAYMTINLNALDDIDPKDVKVTYWDGRHDNWEGGARDKPWAIFT